MKKNYRKFSYNIIVKVFKAAPRFELGIEDLQSTALPLGHTAIVKSMTINLLF